MGDVITYGELRGHADWWPVILDRAYMTDSQFQTGCYLDDRAAAGKWDKAFEILNPPSGLINVNQTRPGSPSRSTVLHWAAENEAPADVVETLIARGAFRSQLDAEGRTAYEIAQKHGRPSILKLLQPSESPLDEPQIIELDRNLEALLDGWLQPRFVKKNLKNVLLYPPVRVLHEAPGQELWSQVPMMSGGFRVILRRGYLEVLLGERRFAESGEVNVTVGCYVITHLGVTPVYRTSGVTWRPGQEEKPTGQE